MNRLRQLVAAAALSALTTGCTVTTGGTVVAAPTLGQAPQPLPTRALAGLLLDTREAGAIMDTSLGVVDSNDSMYRNEPLPDGCLVWADAQEHTYQDSGWTAVRVQELRDRRSDADHIVYQGVVAFPDGLSANQFYASQVTEWAKCDDRRVDLHDPGDPNAHYWLLNKATDNAGVLSITRSVEEGTGWSCQHALTAENNVIVDVSACAYDIGERGVQIAKRIAQNIARQ